MYKPIRQIETDIQNMIFSKGKRGQQNQANNLFILLRKGHIRYSCSANCEKLIIELSIEQPKKKLLSADQLKLF